MTVRTITGVNITTPITDTTFISLYTGHLSEDKISNHINDILFTGGITKTFTDDEVRKYRYHPKLLSYALYGSPDLGLLLLKLNNMYHPADMTLDNKKLQVFTATDIVNLGVIFKSISTDGGA